MVAALVPTAAHESSLGGASRTSRRTHRRQFSPTSLLLGTRNVVLGTFLCRFRTNRIQKLLHEFGHAAPGIQASLADLKLIPHPLGLRLQPFLFVLVIQHHIIQRRIFAPHIRLVHQDVKRLQLLRRRWFILDHLQHKIERVFLQVDIGVVNQEKDAAWLGGAEQFHPIGFPHRVFATYITIGLQLHILVAHFGTEIGDDIAAGCCWGKPTDLIALPEFVVPYGTSYTR